MSGTRGSWPFLPLAVIVVAFALATISAQSWAQVGPDLRPQLVDFWSARCPWCQKQDQVFASPRGQAVLADLRYTRINVDAPGPEWAGRLWRDISGKGVPLLVLLSPEGRLIGFEPGYHDEQAFSTFVRRFLQIPPPPAPPGPGIAPPPVPGDPVRPDALPGNAWPQAFLGTWQLGGGRSITFGPGTSMTLVEYTGTSQFNLQTGDGKTYVAVGQGAFVKFELLAVTNTSISLVFIQVATGTRIPANGVRDGAPLVANDNPGGNQPGPPPPPAPVVDDPGGPTLVGQGVPLPRPAGTSGLNDGWSGPENVSFSGDVHLDSFWASGAWGLASGSIWDMGPLAEKGYRHPHWLKATFGMAPESHDGAKAEIRIILGGRIDAPIRKVIDLNNPWRALIDLNGQSRVEIQEYPLQANISFKAVIVEPRVFFDDVPN